jgi:hypothetical protein
MEHFNLFIGGQRLGKLARPRTNEELYDFTLDAGEPIEVGRGLRCRLNEPRPAAAGG